jgi:hypothetical protein
MRNTHRPAVAVGVLVATTLVPGAWGQARVSISATSPARVQTTVTAPNGGTALAAGFGQSSAVRGEVGAPGWGNVPYLGRSVRNVGYGRSTVSRPVGVSVRVINLREEEFRQTGFRSP